MSSLYTVYSDSLFRNAPVSKIWSCCSLIGSCSLILLRDHRTSFLATLPSVFYQRNYWRLILTQLVFSDVRDIASGCIFIYFMRILERRFGSRKYFFIIIFVLNKSSISTLRYFCPGPHGILFSCLVQFMLDIPWVPYAEFLKIPLSVKNLPFLFALQLFISSRENVVGCTCGLLTGLMLRFGHLQLINLLPLLPTRLTSAFKWLLSPLLNLAEDHQGRLLPIGATLQIQRTDRAERFEQQLILSQIRNRQRQDERQQIPGLRAARRFFGTDLPAAFVNERPEAQEDKVQALMEMGFPNRESVVEALRSTNNDINNAASVLLTQTR